MMLFYYKLTSFLFTTLEQATFIYTVHFDYILEAQIHVVKANKYV